MSADHISVRTQGRVVTLEGVVPSDSIRSSIGWPYNNNDEGRAEPTMSLMVLAGFASVPLAQASVATLGARLGASHVHRFPDGELHVEL